ncbi:MAG: hypothetical protein LBJ32_00255 [Oscillospiraceae bacterium]|jgi:hypothetical protein|nr:hypothetical protein [Oscillospiraceae bacterium]
MKEMSETKEIKKLYFPREMRTRIGDTVYIVSGVFDDENGEDLKTKMLKLTKSRISREILD